MGILFTFEFFYVGLPYGPKCLFKEQTLFCQEHWQWEFYYMYSYQPLYILLLCLLKCWCPVLTGSWVILLIKNHLQKQLLSISSANPYIRTFTCKESGLAQSQLLHSFSMIIYYVTKRVLLSMRCQHDGKFFHNLLQYNNLPNQS